ncbi:hypothetical protein FJZ40_01425 [Candidatus Shapirobacteria bacterium]|nr:hypothetical protein [Candidatus Shapirobacteria bacterium]MBM3283385.1 hypothetical protein [Candidatus Gottesmanbacteria bacterium]
MRKVYDPSYMLPPGHLAVSYILAKESEKKSKSLTAQGIVFIVFCGIIFDLDFFVPYLFGYPGGAHHYFPTHTPLAGIVYFSVLSLMFKNKFSKKTFIVAGMAMILHLVFDDLSYWLCLLGLESNVRPQIFWLYPFDLRRNIEIQRALDLYSQQKITNKDILLGYIVGAPKLFIIEIFSTIAATYIFLRTKLAKNK